MDTNLSENFSSSYFHKKLDNPTFLDFVDVFEYAWTHYTFNPVNLLLNSHCVHGDVAAMSLLCSYFEAIESYRSGKDSNKQSGDFFIKGFRVVFDKITPLSLQ